MRRTVCVSLSPDDFDLAKAIGRGNISAGIRAALARYPLEELYSQAENEALIFKWKLQELKAKRLE